MNYSISEEKTSTKMALLYSPHIAVKELLHSLGITENLNGFKYVLSVVLYAIYNPNVSFTTNRQICYMLAGIYQSTPIAIEHSISRVIDMAWNNYPNFSELLNYTGKTKPNIYMFIKLLKEFVVRHQCLHSEERLTDSGSKIDFHKTLFEGCIQNV